MAGTWVKSCWCFLPSVGKHPFYGLHMPSKPLQLPPLCMYIVNVLPPLQHSSSQSEKSIHRGTMWRSEASATPRFQFFHAPQFSFPRWSYPPWSALGFIAGVTKLKLWSVWKVYWACTSWVLGVTEYIDSLYGEHRDHGDHGNNWWSYILTRWWPPGGGRSVRFGALTTMLQVLILIQIQIQMQIKLKYR